MFSPPVQGQQGWPRCARTPNRRYSLVDAEDESLGLDLDDVAWDLWILIFLILILKGQNSFLKDKSGFSSDMFWLQLGNRIFKADWSHQLQSSIAICVLGVSACKRVWLLSIKNMNSYLLETAPMIFVNNMFWSKPLTHLFLKPKSLPNSLPRQSPWHPPNKRWLSFAAEECWAGQACTAQHFATTWGTHVHLLDMGTILIWKYHVRACFIFNVHDWYHISWPICCHLDLPL